MRYIRVGAGSAYWGDMLDPAVELSEKGNIQYLGFDHLAELTLTILQRMKRRDASKGYNTVPWMKALPPSTSQMGIKILTNAGGHPGQRSGGRRHPDPALRPDREIHGLRFVAYRDRSGGRRNFKPPEERRKPY